MGSCTLSMPIERSENRDGKLERRCRLTRGYHGRIKSSMPLNTSRFYKLLDGDGWSMSSISPVQEPPKYLHRLALLPGNQNNSLRSRSYPTKSCPPAKIYPRSSKAGMSERRTTPARRAAMSETKSLPGSSKYHCAGRRATRSYSPRETVLASRAKRHDGAVAGCSARGRSGTGEAPAATGRRRRQQQRPVRGGGFTRDGGNEQCVLNRGGDVWRRGRRRRGMGSMGGGAGCGCGCGG